VTAVLNIFLLMLAVLSILVALIFVGKGLSSRNKSHRQKYSVAQTEARRQTRIQWIRALFFLLVGLIFLAIFAIRPLFPSPGGGSVVAEATPFLPESSPEIEPTATDPPPTAPANPSPTIEPQTPTPIPTPEPTETPAPLTAVVSSGVGVWLRGSPSTTGQQLEWLLDGTTVSLLPEQQTADDLVWQQVRVEDGQIGWVARDFLVIGEPTPVIEPTADDAPTSNEPPEEATSEP
jgi:hypothetical protein